MSSAPVEEGQAKPGQIVKYGYNWSKETTPIAIELWCYANNHGPENGGLGAEQHFLNAFKMAWPQFVWHEWCYMLIHAWCTEKVTIVLGHTRASKTFISAYIAYLDFCADPSETMTSISTVTFPGLRARMWADLMIAVRTATFRCPFIVRNNINEMKIALPDEKGKPDLKAMIEGFALAKTKDAAEKIQGMHKNRRRWILDEAEGVNAQMFEAESNPMSAPDYKSFKLANPVDKMTAFGLLYEPVGGWDSLSDTELMWRSKKGYLVLHFDGLQSYNIKLYNSVSKEEYDKKMLPFLLTQETVDDIIKNHGVDSIQYWKYVRGFPPPDGTIAKTFPEAVLSKMRQNLIFDYPPKNCAGLDPAFEYDDCIIHTGSYGNNRSNCCTMQYSKTYKIVTKLGVDFPPKDYQVAHEVMRICKEGNILPEDFIMDKTGNARGVFAILQEEWSKKVHGVEFGGSPTERPIKVGDSDKPVDLYCYFVDELWFRLEAWGRAGLIGGLDNLDEETLIDLGARIYHLVRSGANEHGDKQRLETKKEMRERIGRSPDYGDAVVLFAELLAIKGIYVGGNMFLGNVKTQNHNTDQLRRARKASRHFLESNQFGGD